MKTGTCVVVSMMWFHQNKERLQSFDLFVSLIGWRWPVVIVSGSESELKASGAWEAWVRSGKNLDLVDMPADVQSLLSREHLTVVDGGQS